MINGYVRLGRSLVMLAAGMILLAGCAGQEHYDRGRQLLAEGRYDQAVEAFNEALAQSPGSGRFHDGLLEAKSLAADEHVKKATQLVAEKRLSDARKELDVALKLMPAHPDGVPLAAQITPQIAQCEKIIGQARGALARQEWAEGARLIAEAYKIDKSHPQIEELRKEAADTVVGRHLTAARRAMDAGDWDAALAACAQARKVEPNNPDVGAIERQVNDRREAKRLFDSGKAQAAKGELASAVGPLQQAAGLWPDHAEIRAELDRVKGQVVDQLSARARAEAQAGRYPSAIQILAEAMALEPNRDSLQQQRRQVLDGWNARVMEDYNRSKGKGAWERAWVEAVQALAMAPAEPEQARQACLTAEEGIRRGIAYNLSVLLAQSDEEHLNDVLAMCGLLLEEIGSQRPEHVRLTEQSVMSKLLSEFSISSADVNNRDKLQAISQRLRGANVFLFVDMNIQDGRSGEQGGEGAAGSGRSRLDLQMNMVEVSSGRLLWNSAETLALPGAARSGGAAALGTVPPVVHGAEPLTAVTIASLRPAIRSKVAEMYRQHAGSYLQADGATTADTATDNIVRYLFDLPGMPDAQSLNSSLTTVFGSRVSGDLLDACRRTATDRLSLAKGTAARGQVRAVAGPGPTVLPTTHSAPASLPAVAAPPPRPVVPPSTSKPAIAPPAKAPAPRVAPATQPVPQPQPAPTVPPPAEATTAEPRPGDQPVRVFQGIVSRDDDRYPKELATVDGIVVKVLDTDGKPLDADIEIRVGKRKKEYSDKPVGTRIGGYGESGRAYVVVILRIEDDTETVHFAVEATGERRGE